MDRRAQEAIGIGRGESANGADLIEHSIHQLANLPHRRAIQDAHCGTDRHLGRGGGLRQTIASLREP
jgi:hypothetical protein